MATCTAPHCVFQAAQILWKRQDRQIGVAAKLRCAVQDARLASHEQALYAMRPHRGKDSAYRARDQAYLPGSDRSPTNARSPSTARLESTDTMRPTRGRTDPPARGAVQQPHSVREARQRRSHGAYRKYISPDAAPSGDGSVSSCTLNARTRARSLAALAPLLTRSARHLMLYTTLALTPDGARP